MRIGFDLDNTLIDYSNAFVAAAIKSDLLPGSWQGDKNAIRSELRSRKNGEEMWQRLQGQVYGKWINEASLFPAAVKLLARARYRGIDCQIISHKTEFGHFDEARINLRDAALTFLKAHSIDPSGERPLVSSIKFATTRSEKLDLIRDAGIDIFIDDLPELLLDKDFPDHVTPMLFDPDNRHTDIDLRRMQSMDDLAMALIGDWAIADFQPLISSIGADKITDLGQIKGKGNSRIYKLRLGNGKEVAAKCYPNDLKHDRLRAEVTSLQVLSDAGYPVPKPLISDDKIEVVMVDWIEGSAIVTPSDKDIDDAVTMIGKIQSLRNDPALMALPPASGACFSLDDILQQLDERLGAFPSSMPPELRMFFEEEFIPAYADIRAKVLRDYSIDPYQNIARDQQILSPSDFGFHNALRRSDGSLVFFDFEYFGWDDPVKLISDVYFHSGMNLSYTLKERWLHSTETLFGPAIEPRLRFCMPLYGLCWVLITLNEFKDDVWNRRVSADQSITHFRQEVLTAKLDQARRKLAEVSSFQRES